VGWKMRDLALVEEAEVEVVSRQLEAGGREDHQE
jgi:hypothetical protein